MDSPRLRTRKLVRSTLNARSSHGANTEGCQSIFVSKPTNVIAIRGYKAGTFLEEFARIGKIEKL